MQPCDGCCSLGELAMAVFKSWRLLRKLRCSALRFTAVRALAARELATDQDGKGSLSFSELATYRVIQCPVPAAGWAWTRGHSNLPA